VFLFQLEPGLLMDQYLLLFKEKKGSNSSCRWNWNYTCYTGYSSLRSNPLCGC
jgi:hypothetical protein